jgi:predicted nucleic acid-binding protein
VNVLPRTVILDCDGLSRAVAKDAAVHAVLTAAARRGRRVLVPAVVLAEVLTGRASDAQVWHTVNRLVVAPVDRDTAGEAGPLRERASRARHKKRDLTVDAIVAALARQHAPSLVLTCDVDDLTMLCDGADVRVVHPAAVGQTP